MVREPKTQESQGNTVLNFTLGKEMKTGQIYIIKKGMLIEWVWEIRSVKEV